MSQVGSTTGHTPRPARTAAEQVLSPPRTPIERVPSPNLDSGRRASVESGAARSTVDIMEPIPRYWAAVHETHAFPGRGTFALTVNGASDVSVEDARHDARRRLDALVAAGGPGQRGGSDHEYYPSRRLPEELLEEVHDEDGTLVAAVTRNRYGAAVLNTDVLLISDVDLPPEITGRTTSADTRSAGVGKRPGLLSRLLGGGRAERDVDNGSSGEGRGGAAEASGAAAHGTDAASADLPDELGGQGAGERGRAHAQILESIREFGRRHPDLGVRAYRTRNGFRLLVSGTGAHPASDRARALMEEVRSDQLYMLLCRVHDTYRARLTPKPWRVGADRFESLGTRSAKDPEHSDWVRRYGEASAQVAVCRLLEVTGPAPSALEQRIIDLHDRATRPEAGLPLA